MSWLLYLRDQKRTTCALLRIGLRLEVQEVQNPKMADRKSLQSHAHTRLRASQALLTLAIGHSGVVIWGLPGFSTNPHGAYPALGSGTLRLAGR